MREGPGCSESEISVPLRVAARIPYFSPGEETGWGSALQHILYQGRAIQSDSLEPTLSWNVLIMDSRQCVCSFEGLLQAQGYLMGSWPSRGSLAGSISAWGLHRTSRLERYARGIVLPVLDGACSWYTGVFESPFRGTSQIGFGGSWGMPSRHVYKIFIDHK